MRGVDPLFYMERRAVFGRTTLLEQLRAAVSANSLVTLTGLPGVGKSTMARLLIEDLGGTLISLAGVTTAAELQVCLRVGSLDDAPPLEEALDAAQRANGIWKRMLNEYEAPALDPAIDEALLDFIAKRKSELEDRDY